MKKTCWNCGHLKVYADDYPWILFCPKTYTNPDKKDKPKTEHPHCKWIQNIKRGD